MKEHRQLRKFWSFLLAFAMVFTTAVGNIGPVVMAADDDTFVEVTVPNGDFESQTTGWTFNGTEGTNGDTKYWRVFKNEWAQNNKTNWYEAYSHTGDEDSFSFTQTIEGLVPGTYKASVEAAGGNDKGSLTASLMAGNKSV